MRGTGARARYARSAERFIPAHAGNSRSARVSQCLRPVHPRACGEQLVGLNPGTRTPGSSPRMRGTGIWPWLTGDRLRFIPAHAGNRRTRSAGTARQTVHPRACGEQQALPASRDGQPGSSPRMRGTGRAPPKIPPTDRFIPAHAGNRSSSAISMAARTVHPRACGEQDLYLYGDQFANGSSPRMRGTVWLEDIGLSAFLPCQRAYRS